MADVTIHERCTEGTLLRAETRISGNCSLAITMPISRELLKPPPPLPRLVGGQSREQQEVRRAEGNDLKEGRAFVEFQWKSTSFSLIFKQRA